VSTRTDADLTPDEAQDLAWNKLGAVVLEEGSDYVVYKMASEGSDSSPSDSGYATHRVKKIEIGRGRTRREALANAGLT
jgi:hypothetical protein